MVGSSRNPKPSSNSDPNKLSDESKFIIGELNKRFSELSNSFDVLRNHFESILAKKDEEIQELKKESTQLKNRILKLENSMDEEDAYIRRDSLIFSGNAIPAVTNGEICKNIVIRVVEERLKIKISESDISIAHRIGKKPTSQAPDQRQIIAKFCRRDIKRDLIIARKSLSHRSESISLFINESLTPRRRAIYYAVRQMKKAHP